MAAKKFYNNLKLGILGGGQLGRMLLQKAADYNISNSVLDPDPNAPCKNICDEFIVGDFNDYKTVYEFGKKVDVLTIEIEHVNVEALEALEKEGVKVFPQSNIIKLVQDKGAQKIFYRTNGIPTAEFHLIENKKQLSEQKKFLPYVQKLRRGGYDGKGVQVMKSESDFEKGFDAPSVLEKFIPFEKEIAVIVARNESGEVKSFPVVEMEFNPEANLVEFLFSPATISKEIELKAEDIAKKIATDSQIVGVLAVEMFVTTKGEVLVNEIAPRPHNSGHQTIEGNITSQYEQHLRAILDLPLGSTEIISPSVMVNLLGEKDHSGEAKYEGLEKALAMEGVYIHLYGKKNTKPFRKMGHVTIAAKTIEDAKKKAILIKEIIRVIT
ncbi:MAG: 5-(carboxyamino)imidazole ribonucleotide synthase [Bacteroidetes bacterium]|nr:5-(carboxyamino)imidazole ribonucleotide synthase [Bacteroidota bacterium]